MNTDEQTKKLQQIEALKTNLYKRVNELCRETEQQIEEIKAGV